MLLEFDCSRQIWLFETKLSYQIRNLQAEACITRFRLNKKKWSPLPPSESKNTPLQIHDLVHVHLLFRVHKHKPSVFIVDFEQVTFLYSDFQTFRLQSVCYEGFLARLMRKMFKQPDLLFWFIPHLILFENIRASDDKS